MIQTIIPESITVSNGITTITLPDTFIPAAGKVYDIPLAISIPDGTNGSVLTVTNGTISGNILNRLGSNVRLGTLNAQWVLRVRYFEDPAHFNLVSRYWRNV